jgi:hypothetical protein
MNRGQRRRLKRENEKRKWKKNQIRELNFLGKIAAELCSRLSFCLMAFMMFASALWWLSFIASSK